MGAKGAKYLAEALNVNSSMTSVDLSSNELCGIKVYPNGHSEGTYNPTGIKAIADALSVSSSMTSLK